MKTKIIISLLGLFFISGAFGDGCEEEEEPKPDYITVNVSTIGYLYTKQVGFAELTCDLSLVPSKTIKIEIIKAGGERFDFYSQVGDLLCQFGTNAVSFKLYREQPIEITAYAEQVPGGYTQVRGVDYLSWDEVYPQNDFGDTYDYTSEVTILWLFN